VADFGVQTSRTLDYAFAMLDARGYGLREYVPAGSLARGLKYAGRRFQELAGPDNALARTMRNQS
jgi:hypothetical protein